MSGLSPQRWDDLWTEVRKRHLTRETDLLTDALAPLIAGWLAAEREAGAAEVRARVEAVLTEHTTGAVTTLIDRHLLADLRAALNGGES